LGSGKKFDALGRFLRFFVEDRRSEGNIAGRCRAVITDEGLGLGETEEAVIVVGGENLDALGLALLGHGRA
jgi:hypothetical protein